ncbi:MAG TPA: prolipoprotein diacylglyceryl transferase family protein, partial [Symbiobacteriaceae bacterium]|nr:prolipoprotein diacylglyceryl transferase family protein [Symbiobacteriaceae bacterium]
FAVTGLIASAAVTLIYFAVPLVAPPRPLEPTTVLGRLAALERSMSGAPGAFPAFHVLWPLICADAWRSVRRSWGVAVSVWAVLIAVSCVTTGMHAIADVVFAAVLFPVFRHYEAVWAALRRGAERVANSWREWRLGPVRIINHGFYAGIGGAIGIWIAGRLAGGALLLPLVLVAVGALVASVLWAQYVEGSSVLLRPLGWYGGLLGGLVTLGVLALLGFKVLVLMGALAVALPWVQAAGRLRCLVQGCCHGGPAPSEAGICYRHSRSRVTQIAGLTGVPIYPTPLYSILANVVIGVILYRLWTLGAPAGLVIGLYFILSSVARFVEEAYRSEPQTPVFARLHLYQWLALGGFAAGIIFTIVKASETPVPLGAADPRLVAFALLVGIIGWFVTGVDFPGSSRRFSRLAPADDPPRLLRR